MQIWQFPTSPSRGATRSGAGAKKYMEDTDSEGEHRLFGKKRGNSVETVVLDDSDEDGAAGGLGNLDVTDFWLRGGEDGGQAAGHQEAGQEAWLD